MVLNSTRAFSADAVAGRALQQRRVAYYGNVDVDDTIRTTVALFRREGDDRTVGLRYAISRETDGRVICRSEAIKVLSNRL